MKAAAIDPKTINAVFLQRPRADADSDGSPRQTSRTAALWTQKPSGDLAVLRDRRAAGEKLTFPLNGEDVKHRGHAIEFRINAEDPSRNFAPGPGVISTFHSPGGPGVRLDTHVYTGYRVPPNYDSLLAKLIVAGPTRREAIVRARHVLDQFIIEGVPTTIPFLRRIVDDPRFVEGDVDTGFVARMISEGKEEEK